jgi:hypothetical protein
MSGCEAGPRPDLSDQLSPGRAWRESVGTGGSQRVGNNGPLANPVVSFPDEPGPEAQAPRDRG